MDRGASLADKLNPADFFGGPFKDLHLWQGRAGGEGAKEEE